MATYETIPVVFEAIQYTGDPRAVDEFLGRTINDDADEARDVFIDCSYYGCTKCSIGDWVMRGPDKDISICDDRLFKRSFRIHIEAEVK